MPLLGEGEGEASASEEWRGEEHGEERRGAEQPSAPQQLELDQRPITAQPVPELAVAFGDAAPMVASAVGCRRAESCCSWHAIIDAVPAASGNVTLQTHRKIAWRTIFLLSYASIST